MRLIAQKSILIWLFYQQNSSIKLKAHINFHFHISDAMSQKLITVFGATGAQGSSVLRSLAANTSRAFALRGITRNPSGEPAQELSSFGVEIV